MARLPQSEYPVDDGFDAEAWLAELRYGDDERLERLYGTCSVCGSLLDIYGECFQHGNELTVLQQAVRDYFSTRSPQAEDALKRLVGLDASTAFEDAE